MKRKSGGGEIGKGEEKRKEEMEKDCLLSF
jgi:hypothetical protein